MRSLVLGLVLAVVPPAPAAVDDYLAAAVESTGLPGVSVVVTHGDTIVSATGAGHDSTGRPLTADTPMRVASVSKSFTAAAVLTLMPDRLDDPVTDWLPSFPRDVTVRQLLNQTSGIRDSSVDIGRLTAARSLAEYVSMLAPVTLAAPPGTSWAYSNVNYDVAARLVEIVSGRPFAVYMREAVFEPLGMRHSSVGGSAPDGYNSLFGLWFSRPELSDGPAVNGSGAVVTTARDMGKWLMAQTGNGPFSRSMLSTMHAPSTVDEYGMGWSPGEDGLLVHSGNLWTYNAIQAIDPKTGYGYAVMTNGASLTDPTGDILAGLVALTRGQTPEAPGGSPFEWVLAGLTLLSAALGTMGVLRAKSWATRRRSRCPARDTNTIPNADFSTHTGTAPPTYTTEPIRTSHSTAKTNFDGTPRIRRGPPTQPSGDLDQQTPAPDASTRPNPTPDQAELREIAAQSRRAPARSRRWRRTPSRLGPTNDPAARPPRPNNSVSPAQNTSETPTLSRGRPALPVYRQGVTGSEMSILPVDNRVGCGQLRLALRLAPLLLPGLLFACYPQVVSFISAGRTVLWAQLFYFALPLTVTLAVAGVAGLAVVVARLKSVWR